MKNVILLVNLILFSCAGNIPHDIIEEINLLKNKLGETQSLANKALYRVDSLEHKILKSEVERDMLISNHNKEALKLEASNLFYRGNNSLLMKKYNKAINYYLMMIALRPNDAHVYNNLGNAYKEISNYQEAIKCYRKAILIKPDYASAHYNLGIVYQNMDDLEMALDSYRMAARLSHVGIQNWLRAGGYYW